MRTAGTSRCTNTAKHGRLRPAHEPRSCVRGARRISSDERTAVARQLIICLCCGLIHHLFVLAALAVAVGACAGAAGGAAGGAACRRSSRGWSSRDQSSSVLVYDHDIGNIINIDKKILFGPITRRIPWATYQPRRTTTVHSALAPSAVGAVGEGLGLHHSTAACSQTALGRGTPKNGRLVYFGADGA